MGIYRPNCQTDSHPLVNSVLLIVTSHWKRPHGVVRQHEVPTAHAVRGSRLCYVLNAHQVVHLARQLWTIERPARDVVRDKVETPVISWEYNGKMIGQWYPLVN